MKKIDKFFSIGYLIIVALFFIDLFIPFSSDSLLGSNEIFGFIPFLLSIIFLIFFKRTHKNEILKENANSFCKKIKNLSFIIFILLIVSLLITSIILNKDSINYTQNSYFFLYVTYISRVAIDIISKILFPILAVLFLINYQKNQNISSRYYNLKYFVLTGFFLIILILFSRTIALIFYDLGLLIFHKLNLVS